MSADIGDNSRQNCRCLSCLGKKGLERCFKAESRDKKLQIHSRDYLHAGAAGDPALTDYPISWLPGLPL